MGGLAIFSSTMAKSPVLAVICRFFGHPGQDPWFCRRSLNCGRHPGQFPGRDASDFVGRRGCY